MREIKVKDFDMDCRAGVGIIFATVEVIECPAEIYQ